MLATLHNWFTAFCIQNPICFVTPCGIFSIVQVLAARATREPTEIVGSRVNGNLEEWCV